MAKKTAKSDSSNTSSFTVVSDILADLKKQKDKTFNDAAEAIIRANPQAGIDSAERLKPLVGAYTDADSMLAQRQAGLFNTLAGTFQNLQNENAAQDRFNKSFNHQVDMDAFNTGWQNKFNTFTLAGMPIDLERRQWDFANAQRWGNEAWNNRNKRVNTGYGPGGNRYGGGGGAGTAFFGAMPWNSNYMQNPYGVNPKAGTGAGSGANSASPGAGSGANSASAGATLGFKPSYDYFQYGVPGLAVNA